MPKQELVETEVDPLLSALHTLGAALADDDALAHDVRLKLRQLQRRDDGPLTDFLDALLGI